MVRLKEMKMSVHRKYTQDYQSYGFRIGIMCDVEEEAEEAYKEVSEILEKMTEQENIKISKIMNEKEIREEENTTMIEQIHDDYINIDDSSIYGTRKTNDSGDYIQTPKAFLIQHPKEKNLEMWIPKKVLKGESDGRFKVEGWFAKKCGWKKHEPFNK